MSLRRFLLVPTLFTLVLSACADEPPPMSPTDRAELPASVKTILADPELDFWPFTGRSPSLEDASDPINLVFVGQGSPRQIRGALLALNGDRSPLFPPVFPFNCTWKDAMGRPQTAFSEASGWTANVVQLECGEYDPIRFHLRLMELDGFTVANAHMDLLIPGTTEHQVITWEHAEQLVAFDMSRTGLLAAAPAVTDPINPAPFRNIPAVIYNGIPASLRAFIGGPAGDVSSAVPLATDGRATILTLAEGDGDEGPSVDRSQTFTWGQVIPKPFCSSGPADFVLVQGPVRLSLRVVPNAGSYHHEFRALGRLQVTPFDPIRGIPTGDSYNARIAEVHQGEIAGGGVFLNSTLVQLESPRNVSGRGSLRMRMRIGPEGSPQFSLEENCTP